MSPGLGPQESGGVAAFGPGNAADALRTAAGTRYEVSAWVLGDGSNGTARIRVRECLHGKTIADTYSAPRVLTSAWQKLETEVVTARARSELDIFILDAPAAAGESFHVDDVSVRRTLPGDLPPEMVLPSAVTFTPGLPMAMDVVVRDDDGQAIESLVADLSDFPASNSPRFTRDETIPGGRLEWTPRAADVRDAPYRVGFTAMNASACAMSSRIKVAAIAENLVPNDGFEQHLGGWSPSGNATLTRIPNGVEGNWAAQVAGPPAKKEFGVDANTGPVAIVAAKGAVYHIAAWVRSPSSTGKVRFTLSEFSGSTLVTTEQSEALTLGPTWNPMAFDYTTRRAGTRLSLRITDAPAAMNEVFQLDNVSVTLGATATESGSGPGGRKGPPNPNLASPGFARPVVRPNPARGAATLSLSLAKAGPLRVEVFDIAGRLTRVLADGSFPAGTRSFVLRADEEGTGRLAKGIYFYRVHSAAGVDAGRFVILD
jgi:hypothetical protein